MHRTQAPVRIAMALSLFALAAPAFASSPYTVTPVSGMAEALSQTGQVAYVTQTVNNGAAFDGSYYGSLNDYVFSYSLSAGTSGGAAKSLGTSSQLYSPVYSEFVGAFPSNYFGNTGGQGGPSTNSNIFTGTNAAVTGGNTATFGNSTSLGGPHFSIAGVNSFGAIAANAGALNGYGSDGNTPLNTNTLSNALVNLQPYEGLVDNSNGTVTDLGAGTVVSGINSSGAVAYYNAYGANSYNATTKTDTQTKGTVAFASSSGAVTALTDLGYGGTSTGINDNGQLTGGFNTGTYETCVSGSPCTFDTNTRAFRSGANGVGDQVFGTANGVSSFGNAINNSGQVGGFITLASGQTEAFLTTAHGGLLVGLGAGASSDSTAVDFLNNYGQAIIDDSTTSTWYLYSSGYVVPVTSLGANANDPVVGFNDAGQILLQDPQLLTPTSGTFGSASTMASYAGATDITSTSAYQALAAAQGNTTPDSTFFSSPTTSTDTVSTTALTGTGNSSSLSSPTVTQSQYTPAAGVPEPGVWALLLIGALGALGLRRRRYAGFAAA